MKMYCIVTYNHYLIMESSFQNLQIQTKVVEIVYESESDVESEMEIESDYESEYESDDEIENDEIDTSLIITTGERRKAFLECDKLNRETVTLFPDLSDDEDDKKF